MKKQQDSLSQQLQEAKSQLVLSQEKLALQQSSNAVLREKEELRRKCESLEIERDKAIKEGAALHLSLQKVWVSLVFVVVFFIVFLAILSFWTGINVMSVISVTFFLLLFKKNLFVYFLQLYCPNGIFSLGNSLQWGAADAEIKVSSGENAELKRSPFKAWSRSVYSYTCYAYCQGFLSFLLISTLPVHSPAFFPKPHPILPCVGCG